MINNTMRDDESVEVSSLPSSCSITLGSGAESNPTTGDLELSEEVAPSSSSSTPSSSSSDKKKKSQKNKLVVLAFLLIAALVAAIGVGVGSSSNSSANKSTSTAAALGEFVTYDASSSSSKSGKSGTSKSSYSGSAKSSKSSTECTCPNFGTECGGTCGVDGTCSFPDANTSCTKDKCSKEGLCDGGPNGVCVAEPKVCDDNNPCTDDSCDLDTGSCAFDPVDDGRAVTASFQAASITNARMASLSLLPSSVKTSHVKSAHARLIPACVHMSHMAFRAVQLVKAKNAKLPYQILSMEDAQTVGHMQAVVDSATLFLVNLSVALPPISYGIGG